MFSNWWHHDADFWKQNFIKWKEVWIEDSSQRSALSGVSHNNVAITTPPFFYPEISWHAHRVQGENLHPYHWIPFEQCVTNKTPAVIWIMFHRWCTWPTIVVLFALCVVGQVTHLPLLLLVILCDLYPDASFGMVLVLSSEQELVKYFLAGHLPKIC